MNRKIYNKWKINFYKYHKKNKLQNNNVETALVQKKKEKEIFSVDFTQSTYIKKFIFIFDLENSAAKFNNTLSNILVFRRLPYVI